MTVERDARLAAAIGERHGLFAPIVTPIVDAGSDNHVFVIRSGDVTLVVRFAIDVLSQDTVDLEAWALTQAARQGIPSPSVVATGRMSGVPYLVQTFVEGVSGTERRTPELWRTLGEYTHRMRDIAITADAPDGLFSRFGRDLPHAWRAHVKYNREKLVQTDPLIALGVYDLEQQGSLRARIADLEATDLTFGLSHGDLSLKNLLVPEHGVPVLIDWGSARTGPAPFLDFVGLLTGQRLFNDPSDEELFAFADGYGVRLDEIKETLDNLIVLDALDLVRWAIDQRPDLLAEIAEASRGILASYS